MGLDCPWDGSLSSDCRLPFPFLYSLTRPRHPAHSCVCKKKKRQQQPQQKDEETAERRTRDGLRDDDDKKSIIHGSLLPLIISDRIMMMTMSAREKRGERDLMPVMMSKGGKKWERRKLVPESEGGFSYFSAVCCVCVCTAACCLPALSLCRLPAPSSSYLLTHRRPRPNDPAKQCGISRGRSD